ncbi:hypothetical protein TEA_016891 [Camellia sinensis var. sinensis]|uniref:Uncharacterized protein n=1 Tax=Camellia sinensis var. sinensis TaxID=542762 RepID=A0A4S4E7D0_CAMSN|nr:hypothetical protein TEA_016891 [Camellia sinensis var. sinensis]
MTVRESSTEFRSTSEEQDHLDRSNKKVKEPAPNDTISIDGHGVDAQMHKALLDQIATKGQTTIDNGKLNTQIKEKSFKQVLLRSKFNENEKEKALIVCATLSTYRLSSHTGIRQKFEILCLEADGVVHETVGANIEIQLQTMGANIKQLCSEFVHDVMPSFSPDFMEGVAPELSPQQNKNVNLTTQESSVIGVDIDPKKGLCNKNSLAHQYCMEPVDEKHIDLLSKKKDDIGKSEKLDMSVMENATAKKPFPTEIPLVVDTAEKDSSLTSLFCGVNKSNDERWDGQDDLSTPVSLDGYHSCMKEGETTGLTTADNSNVLPSANSVILVESCKCRVSGIGHTSVDAFSEIPSDSCWLGFELPNEVSESEYVSIADSGALEWYGCRPKKALWISILAPRLPPSVLRALEVMLQAH